MHVDRFDGWARRDQTAQFLWDLLFYEPWFLGLGILVTLTLFSCALVVARS